MNYRSLRFVVGLTGLAALGLACGGEPQPQVAAPQPQPIPAPPPPPTTTAEAPPPPPKKSLAELQQAAGKAIAEAFATGDAKKYAALYTENAVIKSAGEPDVVGREAVAKWMTDFAATFSNAKLGESRAFVKGEVVVSEWVMNATHSGELMGFKASEKPVGVTGASIYWFTPEGLIKEEHRYVNMSTVLSQTGISKDKGRPVAALPSGAPEVVIAKDSAEEKANVEVLEKINKAWEAKKADELVANFTDDATWDDVTLPSPSKGKKEISKYASTFFKAVPDGKLATTNAWGFGDWVVEEGTFSGTHKGAMFGMAASNKTFTIHEVTIAKLGSDKKIVQAVTYANGLELVSQLDPKSLPKPPTAKAGDKGAAPAKAGDKGAAPAKAGDKGAAPAKAGDKGAAPAKAGDKGAAPAKAGDKK
jgi:steroid delta-isomerase-like uncharacterized protein